MRTIIRLFVLSLLQFPAIYMYATTGNMTYFIIWWVMATLYITLLSIEVANNSIFADEIQQHFLDLLQAIGKTQAKLRSMKDEEDEDIEGDN